MGALFVVVVPPAFDLDLGFGAIAKPFERQAFVSELPVEGFVGAILPGLARIDEGRVDVRGLEPPEDRRRDELGAVVGPEIAWGAVKADQLREHFNDAPRSETARHVNRQTLVTSRSS